MSKTSDTIYRAFRVVDPSTGLGVTGLTSADFTLASYSRAYGAAAWASYSASIAIAEIADGWYALTFTNPAAAGYRLLTIKPVSPSTRKLTISGLDGEVMSQDLASLYSAVAKPVITLAGSGTIGQVQPLTLVAYRWRQVVFVFKDSNGVAIDLTQYNNLLLSVRDKSQSDATAKWDLTTAAPTPGTISGDASGNLTVTFPEDAGFFAKLTNPATDLNPYTLYYEVTGDYTSSTAKTVALIPSSPLTLTRREVGT